MWKAGVFSNLNPPDGGGHSQPTKISNAGDVVARMFLPPTICNMDFPLTREDIRRLMCHVFRAQELTP
jgi:hypothetical protein